MNEKQALLEKADHLFKEKRLEEAAQYYHEAALLLRQDKEHAAAAHAFGQAALCEKVRVGFEPLIEAAAWSEMAALEAQKACRYGLARWYFREAALIYEREGEFDKYSQCFRESQDAHLDYLMHLFCTGEKQPRRQNLDPITTGLRERFAAFLEILLGFISKWIWGYGEKPWNVTAFAAGIIILSAVLYQMSGLVAFQGSAVTLSFEEALYMSGITFSTLGYGDFIPLGWVRGVSVVESLCGFVTTPLFVVSLTRRYLRVYR